MVAINADRAVLHEEMELPRGSAELAPHIYLVPPVEGMESAAGPDQRTTNEFSQDAFSQLVKQCYEAIPLPRDKPLSARIANLVVQKDDMLKLLPGSERPAAVLSAYDFLFEKPPVAIAV